MVVRRAQRGHRYTESPVLQLALQGWRSRTVGLVLMFAFLALVARSFYLQVTNVSTNAIGDVFAYRSGEQERLLFYDSNLLPKVFPGIFVQRNPIQ